MLRLSVLRLRRTVRRLRVVGVAAVAVWHVQDLLPQPLGFLHRFVGFQDLAQRFQRVNCKLFPEIIKQPSHLAIKVRLACLMRLSKSSS